jgi:hypothetical protein
MRPELRSLILDYQARVADACRLISERLGLTINNPFGWRQNGISPKGWLDDAQTIAYRFHGIGCCVTFGKVTVDFDFGPEGRFDGFDAWRLSLFAKSVRQYSAFTEHDPLHAELKTLHSNEEIINFPDQLGSHLFFFPSTFVLLTHFPRC